MRLQSTWELSEEHNVIEDRRFTSEFEEIEQVEIGEGVHTVS